MWVVAFATPSRKVSPVGHSGGQLIYSTYGHVNSQHKRDAAAKLQFDAGVATSKELAPVPDLSKMSAADLLALLQRVNINAAP
jgi:hypothetical protein